MAQCKGTTKKGDRCKREAPENEAFCSIHVDQAIRERPTAEECIEWDRDAVVKAAIGFALVGAILFFRIRR